jgi:hypothetical protein
MLPMISGKSVSLISLLFLRSSSLTTNWAINNAGPGKSASMKFRKIAIYSSTERPKKPGGTRRLSGPGTLQTAFCMNTAKEELVGEITSDGTSWTKA